MSTQTLPAHIAIIMDGNRRWARQNAMEAFKGHEYVANKIIEELTEAALSHGVKYLTLWAFSTENWHRDQKEVDGLMNLFRESFKKNAKTLHEKGVRLNMIGDIAGFPQDIQDNIRHWMDLSKNNTNITVTFALNYGGRDEITRAFNKALEHAVNTFQATSQFQNITKEEFSHYLDTKDLPDPDLIIRPGGEQRLSGFLPWQSVYSEFYFTDVLMPDFNANELKNAIEVFQQRQRRFGR